MLNEPPPPLPRTEPRKLPVPLPRTDMVSGREKGGEAETQGRHTQEGGMGYGWESSKDNAGGGGGCEVDGGHRARQGMV